MAILKSELKRFRDLFTKCGPIFTALGDEVRQRLVLDIADAGEEGISVMGLTSLSNLSRPAISHHLKVLKDCGLVETQKKGTWVFYRISVSEQFEKIDELLHEILKIAKKAKSNRSNSGKKSSKQGYKSKSKDTSHTKAE